jgi:riboflavin kinase/FMN adenylyltransferase
MQQRANELNTETVIVTFDPHPALSTSGEAPPSITTIEKKIELLKAIGINRVIVEDFNEEFSHLSPEEFVYDILIGEFHAQEIVVGYDCAFGKDRAGDKWLLKKLGEKYGTEVEIIEPYNLNGDVVSSTRVRNAIQQGDISLSNKLLGRLYSISGIIVPGKGIGKKIGYATANLQTQNEVLPPSGVYAVRVHIEDQPLDGVLNMGIQPTLGDGKFRIEVHILDFEGELGQIPGVTEQRTEKGYVELALDGNTTPKQVLERLVSTGIIINRFEVATPSLNEIFLEVAGKNHE